MRENNLRAPHGDRSRHWSVGKPSVLIPNLLQRQFTVRRPNATWVTDITFIRTWQAGSTWRRSRICSRANESTPWSGATPSQRYGCPARVRSVSRAAEETVTPEA